MEKSSLETILVISGMLKLSSHIMKRSAKLEKVALILKTMDGVKVKLIITIVVIIIPLLKKEGLRRRSRGKLNNYKIATVKIVTALVVMKVLSRLVQYFEVIMQNKVKNQKVNDGVGVSSTDI